MVLVFLQTDIAAVSARQFALVMAACGLTSSTPNRDKEKKKKLEKDDPDYVSPGWERTKPYHSQDITLNPYYPPAGRYNQAFWSPHTGNPYMGWPGRFSHIHPPMKPH